MTIDTGGKQVYTKTDIATLNALLDLIPKISDADKQTLLGVALGLSAKSQDTGQTAKAKKSA